MEEIRVIANKDGADLRRDMRKHPYHSRCDGTADDVEINEAIESVGKAIWGLPDGAWERIFRGNK